MVFVKQKWCFEEVKETLPEKVKSCACGKRKSMKQLIDS